MTIVNNGFSDGIVDIDKDIAERAKIMELFHEWGISPYEPTGIGPWKWTYENAYDTAKGRAEYNEKTKTFI